MECQKGDFPFLFYGLDQESSTVEVDAVVKVAPVTNPSAHFPFTKSFETGPLGERGGFGGFYTEIIDSDP
tara:strand:- start:187 stop:396 length:210 start_codon:yes stop_codon:yes gene_type:complete